MIPFIPATYTEYNGMMRDLRQAERSYDLGAYCDSAAKSKALLARILGRTWGNIEPRHALDLHKRASTVRSNSLGALRCWLANH
jgi:hypothetical protein